MKLHAQITKVDEEKRLVYGRAVAEVVDKSDEIFDYESSKPHFQKWSEEISADTGGKSLGNVRAMHGKVVAGVLKGIEFNDAEKAIDIEAHIVDDNEWNKVTKGCYTGFSIGGSYVGERVAEKMDGRDVNRYTAKPNEISIVDRPCVPTAKFFSIHKADGAVEEVEFQAPAEPTIEEQVQEVEINGSAEDVLKLAKFMGDNKIGIGEVNQFLESATAAGADLTKSYVVPEPKVLTLPELRKGMYSCSQFANVIEALLCLKSSAAYEAYVEADNSPLPKRIGQIIQLCGEVLKEMITEELKEYQSDDLLALSEKAGSLVKGELCLTDIFPAETLLKHAGHTCGAHAAPATDAVNKFEGSALEKAVASALAPVQEALRNAEEKITKLEAQPAPTKLVLKGVVVGKAADTGTDASAAPAATEAPPAPIVDAHGEQHTAAGFIKSLHQKGGAPLLDLSK